ncbi:hypothetical protein [Paenibacillus lemnae]|uniref:Uncharacterized protein n=1 Tax=Paenibacillus lemnae TaxID=1330551 RepID=A0A848M182_PAELE|nr:hypothetical protein [Paenibacillus lemnae]NMO94688.1 hypothetical protein [Paenibacillus lemnae]
MMEMDLRRLVYNRGARKASISHVPVFACQNCSAFELMPLIKQDVVTYITSLERKGTPLEVSLADICEPASLLRKVLRKAEASSSPLTELCKEAFDERINMLLDLYRFAKNNRDYTWMEEIQQRLEKLTLFLKRIQEHSDIYAS